MGYPYLKPPLSASFICDNDKRRGLSLLTSVLLDRRCVAVAVPRDSGRIRVLVPGSGIDRWLPAREGMLPLERHVASKASVPRCSPSSPARAITPLHSTRHCTTPARAGCFSEAVSFVTHPLRPPQGRAASASRERVPYILGPCGSLPPTLGCSTTAQHCRTAAQSVATEWYVLQASTTLQRGTSVLHLSQCSATVQPVATQCNSCCGATELVAAHDNQLQRSATGCNEELCGATDNSPLQAAVRITTQRNIIFHSAACATAQQLNLLQRMTICCNA